MAFRLEFEFIQGLASTFEPQFSRRPSNTPTSGFRMRQSRNDGFYTGSNPNPRALKPSKPTLGSKPIPKGSEALKRIAGLGAWEDERKTKKQEGCSPVWARTFGLWVLEFEGQGFRAGFRVQGIRV